MKIPRKFLRQTPQVKSSGNLHFSDSSTTKQWAASYGPTCEVNVSIVRQRKGWLENSYLKGNFEILQYFPFYISWHSSQLGHLDFGKVKSVRERREQRKNKAKLLEIQNESLDWESSRNVFLHSIFSCELILLYCNNLKFWWNVWNWWLYDLTILPFS